MHNLGNKTIEYTTTDGNTKWKAAVLGLQHLLAMYAGAVAVPFINRNRLEF